MEEFPKNFKRKWNSASGTISMCFSHFVLIGNTKVLLSSIFWDSLLKDPFVRFSILNIVCYPNTWLFPFMTNLRLNRSFNSFFVPTCLCLLFSFLLSLSSLDIFKYSEDSSILQNNKRKLLLDPVAHLMPCNYSFLPQPLAIFMINLHSLLLPPIIHAPYNPCYLNSRPIILLKQIFQRP